MWGRLMEVAVGAYLVNEASRLNIEVYYWRKGNYEVDFVVAQNGSLTAFEVKSGKRRVVLSGLEKFRESYKNANVLTVGTQGIEIKEFFGHLLDR